MGREGLGDLYRRYSDVHPNIVLKTEILRLGLDIGDRAIENFRVREDLLWKGFHLFSYDWHKTKVYGNKIPWFAHLED